MKIGGKNKLLSVIFVGVIFFVSLLFSTEPALAGASIFFSPSSPKVNTGDVFEMSVYVRSTEQAMNACEAEITFPTDKLEILSVSSKNSIFNLMVQSPTFSNKTGVIGFSGVVLNPGYSGSSGRMITLSFRAKNAGTAKLNFNSAQVLANDGLGTDILSVASSAIVTIGQKQPEPIPEKPITTETEGEINIPAAGTSTEKTTESTTTTEGTGLPAPSVPTSAVVLLTSTACTYDQLPAFFVKLGGLNFGLSGLLIILLIISILIAIFAFVKAKYLENLESQLHEHLRSEHLHRPKHKHRDE